MDRKYELEEVVVGRFMKAMKRLNEAAASKGGRNYTIKFHGSAYHAGEPDVIGCINGKAFAIEFKSPDAKGLKGKPTSSQMEHIKKWRAGGAMAGWANNLDDALDIIGARELYESVKEKKAKRKTKDISGDLSQISEAFM